MSIHTCILIAAFALAVFAACSPADPNVHGRESAACPDSSAPGSDACVQLESCCGQLDDEDDQEDCEEALEDGDAAACADAVTEFCMTGAPVPPPAVLDACGQLESCCGRLDDEDDEEECEEAVEEGDTAACTDAIASFCKTLTPTAPPASLDPCAQLESCCARLDDDDQEDCEELVEDAEAAVCAEELATLCG